MGLSLIIVLKMSGVVPCQPQPEAHHGRRRMHRNHILLDMVAMLTHDELRVDRPSCKPLELMMLLVVHRDLP